MQVKSKISKIQATYLHVSMFLTSTIHDYLFFKVNASFFKFSASFLEFLLSGKKKRMMKVVNAY